MYNSFKVDSIKPEWTVIKGKMFCVLSVISLFTAKLKKWKNNMWTYS